MKSKCIFPPGLAAELGQMRILPFISKWVWDQFMWQQLPGLLHLVLLGIYRKKILYFSEDFCKKQQQKTPIHPNPVTESQKRGGTKRLTIVTHITANSDPLQNLEALGCRDTFGGSLQETSSHPYYLPTYYSNIPSHWKNWEPWFNRYFRGTFFKRNNKNPSLPSPHPRKTKTSPLLHPQPRHY